ncbi:MAG: DUF4430 domain-containing protein [Ruminococcaceae bacterium]|nr:DUF4430 domain-containing protein [Oscillospiraceae bacterium]
MTTNLKKMLSVIVCIVLLAAVALFTIGCSSANDKTDPIPSDTTGMTVTSLGEGERQFDFYVTDANGNTTKFVIKTDKKIVGEALLELKLIEGEEGPYGLYVKKVNGITADYDTDKTYWAFYVDGEYAMSGVDTTEIESGKVYSFKIEK